MSEKFKGQYQVDDGYAGPSRPKYFQITEGDLEDDMTDDDLISLYEEYAEDAFQQQISYSLSKQDEFIKWAREKLDNRQ